MTLLLRQRGILSATMAFRQRIRTQWAGKLTIDGLVDNPMTLSIDDLKQRFEVVNPEH